MLAERPQGLPRDHARRGAPDALSVRRVPLPTTDVRRVLISRRTAVVGSWDAETRAAVLRIARWIRR